MVDRVPSGGLGFRRSQGSQQSISSVSPTSPGERMGREPEDVSPTSLHIGPSRIFPDLAQAQEQVRSGDEGRVLGKVLLPRSQRAEALGPADGDQGGCLKGRSCWGLTGGAVEEGRHGARGGEGSEP